MIRQLMKRLSLTYAAFGLLLALTASCHREEYRSVAGATWGTTYHITYKAASDLNDTILHQMRMVDFSLSPFVEESLISKINQGDSAKADALFEEVFALSQRVCSISGGAFDPTISPLINLWGFGYKEGLEAGPTPEQIDSALASVGILQCSIAPDGQVIKKSPATEFNFSAIAKGYGVDLIAKALERNGCHDYMVEVGGELALAGKNSRGEDWRIQVDAPVDDPTAHSQLAVIAITDCAIATSGNYRNNRLLGDSLVYHTISTITGRPALTSTLSATIIAPDCAFADALATSAMALPTGEAVKMLDSLEDIGYILVSSDTILSNMEIVGNTYRFLKKEPQNRNF